MGAVPAKEEIEVLLEPPSIIGSRLVPGKGPKRDHQRVERVVAPPAQAFFVARVAGTFSVLPIRSMYFCWAI